MPARIDRLGRSRRASLRPLGPSTAPIGMLAATLLAMLLATAACERPGEMSHRPAVPDALWKPARDEGEKGPLAARFAAALDAPDPLDRHMQLAEVYAEVRSADVPALLEVFERNLRGRRAEEVRAFANLLARNDPESALGKVLDWEVPLASAFGQAEVMSIAVSSGSYEKVRKVLQERAANAPVETIHQGEMAVVEALARHRQLEPIVGILEGTQDVDHRRRMVAKVALVMSQTTGSTYPDWAEQLHREHRLKKAELEDELLLQAVRVMAFGAPGLGTDYYERIKDARCSGDALAVIGERWAYSDPEAALAYMKSRPPSEKTGMGKRAVAIIWLQQDPAKAEPAIRDAIEQDPGMSSVILPFVQFQMAKDLPGSMLLAQRIPDDEERVIALKQGLIRWAQRDAAAVDAYMKAHPVGGEVEEAVRNAKRIRQNRADT